MISEAIAGAVIGGGLRLAPELLRLIDAVNERRHELAMQRIHLEFTARIGATRVPDELTPGDEALVGMFMRQEARAARRWPWIDAVASLVRPSVTGLLLALYVVVKMDGLLRGSPAYGPEDMAMLNAVLAFWFLGRVWDRKTP
jgi:hypothetical protein